jgi:hypothetical protein
LDLHAPGDAAAPRHRLLLPYTAYHRDYARAGRTAPFGSSDGRWLLIASLLDYLGALPVAARDQMLIDHERVLAHALGPDVAELPPDHPFVWVSRLRVALTANPLEAEHDAVTTVVQRMAAEMAELGALELAEVTLDAAGRAFPAPSPARAVDVLLQRARIAEARGLAETAREMYDAALDDARAAGLDERAAEARRQRRRLGRTDRPRDRGGPP